MTAAPVPCEDFFESVRPLTAARADFEARGSPSSSLSGSYAGLLQWQDHYGYALADRQGVSFVLAAYGRHVYLPLPPRPFTAESLQTAFEYLSRANGPGDSGVSRVEGSSKAEADLATSLGYPVRLVLEEYVYDRERTAGLHGDAFRAKRADVNHLVRHQAVDLRRYDEGHREACQAVFERWSAERRLHAQGEMGEAMLRHAAGAHGRILSEGPSWGLTGWVALVEGEVMAYTFGAPLSPDTFGVLVEVADLTVRGLSSYIFSRVCGEVGDYAFVNAGDAEGLPGLAEAKSHWHPVRMNAVYAVDRRPGAARTMEQ